MSVCDGTASVDDAPTAGGAAEEAEGVVAEEEATAVSDARATDDDRCQLNLGVWEVTRPGV